MPSLARMLDRFVPPDAPFRVLCRVFLLRVVDLELLSADADTSKLLGQFGSMFASASFMFTAPVIILGDGSATAGGGTLPPNILWTMEHLFFATTMAVVGLFAVFSWESIFPDKRDLLILCPLPVHVPTLFFAKLSALAGALALAVLSLNCFTGIFWPLLFAVHDGSLVSIPRAIFAYWLTVTTGGIFVFCAVLSLHGMASLLLPRQSFLKISAWLQLAGFCLLLRGYILEPSLESKAALTAPGNQHLLACLPAYWFLGLFQQLNGSMQPMFAPLARRAWFALAITIIGAIVSVLVAYFRSMPRIVEEPDILPASRRARKHLQIGAPLRSAIVAFTTRTILRSRPHRVLFAIYASIGLTVVIIFLKTPVTEHAMKSTGDIVAPFLEASTLMMVFSIVGARIAFALPITLRANWIFRMTEVRRPAGYLGAVRTAMLAVTVLPVSLAFAIATTFLWPRGWPIWSAITHIALLVLLGTILVEIALARFRKLPFTASYLPGKANIQFLFWVALIGLIPLAGYTAGLEEWALHSGLRCVEMIVGLVAILGGIRWWVSAISNAQKSLCFEETNPEYLISLQINPR
jgi:hypothetical protein